MRFWVAAIVISLGGIILCRKKKEEDWKDF